MGNKGFVRRMLPFLAAFTVGIFITSFFVNITGPGFRGRGFGKRHQEIKRLRIENEEQRIEILRLRNEIEQQHRPHADMFHDHDEWMHLGPEFPVEETTLAPPAVAPRVKR